MKRLHDVNAAAELLSVSPWTIRSYVKQGKLISVHIGRRVLLEECELERFVMACKGAEVPNEGLEIVGGRQPNSERGRGEYGPVPGSVADGDRK